MGAGKTKVGRLVADVLRRGFADTDALVEERTGRRISDIFASEGEDAFRRLETQAIAEALSEKAPVVALGGGAAAREENWNLLRRADALAVYLRATPETILERVANHAHRPLLSGLDRAGKLKKIRLMLEQREPWYQRADLVIPSDNSLDKYAMADMVVERLAKLGIT